MAVVKHDDGYALVELIGNEGELSKNDSLYGDWSANGGEIISKNRVDMDVYLQGSWPNDKIPIALAENG